jgi:RNA polymerase sigma-70 factor, ECF subfamily
MELNEFKNILIPVSPKLLRFASRMLTNHEDARDVVQDVFLKLWLMRNNLETYRNIEALAMTITRNACIDHLRKRKTLFKPLDFKVENSEDGVSVEQILTGKEEYESVLEMINDLPEQQRAIVHLKDIEGYSTEDIMEILNINANTLRVNLSRARSKLRELIVRKNMIKWTTNR